MVMFHIHRRCKQRNVIWRGEEEETKKKNKNKIKKEIKEEVTFAFNETGERFGK